MIFCFVILAAFICTFYFLFTDSEIQPIDTVLEERGGIIAVYDKTILFMEIHDQNADFFVYDPAAKCGIHIDTIENVKMISHEMILEGHFLYANIILNEKGDPSYTYKINLRDRSATPIHKIESYDTFAPIAKRGDEIAILECKTSDNIHGESIISTFRNSADSNIFLTFKSNREDYSGEYVWDFSVFENSLFTLTDHWTENKIFLEEYDSHSEKVDSLDITKTMDYLEKQRVKVFSVFKRFAFISNVSRSSVLLSISGNEAFHVVESSYETPFVKAVSNNDEPIFFISNSPFVFYLDEENGKLIQTKIKLGEECRIKNLYIGENMTVLTQKDTDEIYMIDNRDLFSGRKKTFSLKKQNVCCHRRRTAKKGIASVHTHKKDRSSSGPFMLFQAP